MIKGRLKEAYEICWEGIIVPLIHNNNTGMKINLGNNVRKENIFCFPDNFNELLEKKRDNLLREQIKNEFTKKKDSNKKKEDNVKESITEKTNIEESINIEDIKANNSHSCVNY